MNQPLGYAVGNALEIKESIEVLKNEKHTECSSTDLKELTIHLCAHMLHLGGVVRNLPEGRKLSQNRLSDGSAWKTFQNLVQAQGGKLDQILNFPDSKAPVQLAWPAKKRGFITKMNTENLGRLLVDLGGGRKKVTDPIDPDVGLVFHKKLGSKVQIGEPLVTLYANESTPLPALEAQFYQSIEIASVRKAVPKLIFEEF
jgi:pyrimidine-nucleoside phosphorylase